MNDPFEKNLFGEGQQQTFNDQDLLGILKKAKSAYLSGDQNFLKLINAASISEDPEFFAMAQEYITQKSIQQIHDPFPFDSPSNKVSEPRSDDNLILIGKIKREDHRPFLYKKDNFNKHMVITGGTGTGKTSLLYSLILQLILYGCKILVFDRDKKDHRHLKRFKLGKDFKVIRGKNFIFNVLQVPTNVNIQDWIVSFCFIFTYYFDLLSGSEGFLIPILTSLYQDYGIFEGKTTYPCLHDLYDRIKVYPVKGYAARYKDTVLNRIESYLALIGPACEYSKGIPVEFIAANNIVFEISELTERASRFFVAIILFSLFKYRIASGMIGDTVRNIAVIDEARYLVPPNINHNLTSSPITSLLSQCREAKMGLILSDQSAQLEPSVFVNTFCKCTYRLGNGRDIRQIVQSMSLTNDQGAYITKMTVGEMIVRIPGEDPFVIETLPVNIK